MALSCSKKFAPLFRGRTSNQHGNFYCLTVFIHTPHLINLKNMKEYVIIMITVVETRLKKIKKKNIY